MARVVQAPTDPALLLGGGDVPASSAGPSGVSEPWGSNILLVDANLSDAHLLQQILKEAPDDFFVVHVHRLSRAVEALQRQEFSIVLLDLHLPDGLGIDSVKEITGAAPNAPIVVLSGRSDQDLALSSLQAGAQDFLTKGTLDEPSLLRSMRFAIQRKRTETRLAYLAHHDQLTGLLNRTLFRERLGRALSRAKRTGHPLAVLYLDLDRFKEVNDNLGHEVGDQLLVQVAMRLRSCVRAFEPVARLGGDEFVMAIEGVDETHIAETVCRRVLAAMSVPFRLGSGRQRVSTSIGVAIAEPGDLVDSILERADAAMYRAKRSGRNTYAISGERAAPVQTSEREPSRTRRKKRSPTAVTGANDETLTIEEDVERALHADALEVLYQPKLDLFQRKVSGAEAMLRHRYDRNNIGLFGNRLLKSVADWGLRRACEQARRFAPEGLQFRLALNITPQQFAEDDFVVTLAEVLSSTGFPAEALELELPEEVILGDASRSRDMLPRLRGLGARISLDHFAARSPLDELVKFPLDIIKLDRSLIEGIVNASEQRTIVSSVVNVSRNLGIETVAEGVESAAERLTLCGLGCDSVQGFHVCGPMEAAGFTVWLASHEADCASTP